MTLAPPQKTWFQKKILGWYAQHGRHDLPWKKALSPYRVWISEIMLQQTQVATVIPYFEKFMRSFPEVSCLAKASTEKVLHHWAGLGYYARGRNLHKAAQIIMNEHAGLFPDNIDALVALPGIGLSTAGAIIAQAFDRKATICDGNVKRVLSRFHCVPGPLGQKDVENALWALAVHYTPTKQVADYTQAIMDIGATLCTRTKPQCDICPLQSRCAAFKNNTQSQFPKRKRAKALPTKETYFLCAINAKQEILLYERPASGIWGGLWSLPEFESEQALRLFLKRNKLGNIALAEVPALKHSFTHFHLILKPFLVLLNNNDIRTTDLKWVNPKKRSTIGLPAPINKLLEYDMISQKMRAHR